MRGATRVALRISLSVSGVPSLMYTSRKFGSLAVSAREDFIFAGTMGGEVVAVRIDDFAVVSRLHVHSGAIEVTAAHPTLPFVAAMSMDRSVSVLEWSGSDSLTLVDRFGLRDVQCWNDHQPVPYNYSLSQALTFHPASKRLAVRSARAGVTEFDFSSGRLELLHCSRVHGEKELVTLRYADDRGTLISGAAGEAVLSRNGLKLQTWNFGNYNLHWFEPLGDDEYLIACDELYVIRLDLRDRHDPICGKRLTRDDLEHVTYNSTSKRAFVSGFDGTVYEIDPATCDYKGIAYVAPYKMRWIKTLERDPDTLLIHCFNGALYKVSLEEQRALARVKETPNAIWTCVRKDDVLYFAGEGEVVRPVTLTGVNRMTSCATFELCPPIYKGDGDSYTKRMVTGPSGLLLAQKHGKILEVGGNGVREIADLGEELRDLAVVPDGSAAFVCTERAKVFKIDTSNGEILCVHESADREPIWSLAYHAERDLIAFAGRRGKLVVAEGETLRPVFCGSVTSRPKRMKWCDDTLIYVQTGRLRKFDLNSSEISDYVSDCENTIEDFIWDDERQYLVLVGYRTEVVLCDFKTGEKLSVVPDQWDFSKGLMWINRTGREDAYPLDFVTFGRTGTAHMFRIHNERCIAMGPVAENLI